jgi:hypothetical protein
MGLSAGKDLGARTYPLFQKKSQSKDAPNKLSSNSLYISLFGVSLKPMPSEQTTGANPTLCTVIFIKFQPNQADPVKQPLKNTESVPPLLEKDIQAVCIKGVWGAVLFPLGLIGP